uniref:3-oxoacyl-[acyl-carrier-protein] synthase n=1 Tax=Clastoptera arizonana TaxID=38151 RepID=A0A1B6CBB1_9HEMI
MNKKRVVVTGLGIISPLGVNFSTSWKNLIDGKCGVVVLKDISFSKLPCKVAACIPNKDEIIKSYFSKNEIKNTSPATMLGLIAAEEALASAKWKPDDKHSKQETGVCVGMGMVDLTNVCDTNEALQIGYNRVSPYFVPRILTNMAAGQISIRYGFQGPNHSVSTACATGAHAIGDGFKFIQQGYAKVMVCGGAEACINPLSIAGFSRLRALSTSFNESPSQASRPFDKHHDGFVMGEGAAILVLEELNHAVSRGVDIYAEILGYGLSGDGSHLTAPHENGDGAILSMQRALIDAKLDTNKITYINAHATSTPLGDSIELKAIKTLFNSNYKNLAISSTKGAHGHLLGSAGNLESCFTVLACLTSLIPPTINLQNVCDDGIGLNLVANEKQAWNYKRRIALKNSFGFGGTNASLCFGNFLP